MKPVVHLIKNDTYVIWNNIGVSGDHVHQIIGLDDMEYEERRDKQHNIMGYLP